MKGYTIGPIGVTVGRSLKHMDDPDAQDTLTDLLTDLRLSLDTMGIDFDVSVQRSELHYSVERIDLDELADSEDKS